MKVSQSSGIKADRRRFEGDRQVSKILCSGIDGNAIRSERLLSLDPVKQLTTTRDGAGCLVVKAQTTHIVT